MAFARNHAYLTIMKKYQLDLGDKGKLRKQIDDVILQWKAYWFTTYGKGGKRVGSDEEKIVTEVTRALIFGMAGTNCPPPFPADELKEDHVVTALALVSNAYLYIYFSDEE